MLQLCVLRRLSLLWKQHTSSPRTSYEVTHWGILWTTDCCSISPTTSLVSTAVSAVKSSVYLLFQKYKMNCSQLIVMSRDVTVGSLTYNSQQWLVSLYMNQYDGSVLFAWKIFSLTDSMFPLSLADFFCFFCDAASRIILPVWSGYCGAAGSDIRFVSLWF